MQAVCSSRNAALLQLTLRIVRKLLWMLLVLWGITLISFWVIHLAPGSPTFMETTLNPLAGEAARQRLEALYGLDKPCMYNIWTGSHAWYVWISACPCQQTGGPCWTRFWNACP